MLLSGSARQFHISAPLEGRDTLLTFEKNIGSALKKACDHDSYAMHLARAAEVVLREMFEKNLRLIARRMLYYLYSWLWSI